MDTRHLPPSRNIEDRRDERDDPLQYLWTEAPREVLAEQEFLHGQPSPAPGPASRALGIGDIGSRPRPPSLYDMMGQGRDLPLPQIQGSPPWRMIRGR